jgi:hypothetical protein
MAAQPVSPAPSQAFSIPRAPARHDAIAAIASEHMPPANAEPSRTITVLPLTALADKSAINKVCSQMVALAKASKIAEARACILDFKKSLTNPLDPQKLIWRAFCAILLSFLELKDLREIPEGDPDSAHDRLRGILSEGPNDQKIENSRVLFNEALRDLETAQRSVASNEIVTQNALRHELYLDLLQCYTELSKNLNSVYFGAEIHRLQADCAQQLSILRQAPVSRDKTTRGYSTITKLFALAVGLLIFATGVTLYKQYKVTRL